MFTINIRSNTSLIHILPSVAASRGGGVAFAPLIVFSALLICPPRIFSTLAFYFNIRRQQKFYSLPKGRYKQIRRFEQRPFVGNQCVYFSMLHYKSANNIIYRQTNRNLIDKLQSSILVKPPWSNSINGFGTD